VRPYSSGTGSSALICACRLLVLVSQGRQPTTTFLSTSALTLSQGELAVQHLLNVVRSGVTGTRLSGQREAYAARTLSFPSGNAPRDRRGRIARCQPLRLQSHDTRVKGGSQRKLSTIGEANEPDLGDTLPTQDFRSPLPHMRRWRYQMRSIASHYHRKTKH
jgi:hypothetical protein